MSNMFLERKGTLNSLTSHINGNIRREYFLCEIGEGYEFWLEGQLEYVNLFFYMSNVGWTAILLTLSGLILGLTRLAILLK